MTTATLPRLILNERLTFQQEAFVAEHFEEAKPLLEAHWQEIAHWKDIQVLDPDWDAYRLMDERGFLRGYSVREDGELKGYAVFFLRGDLHYKQCKHAVQDILYLDPSLRGGMIGARFILWCEEQLAKEGVAMVTQHVKFSKNFGPLLQRLGYEAVETSWWKRLVK